MDNLSPSHRQIQAITNMVAFFTIGDKNAHSVVTSESVGVLTGVYKLPADMNRFEAMKVMNILINRKRNKQGRMYHTVNKIVDDFKSKLKDEPKK